MKYKIKDPKKRNLVNELLSVENFKSSTPNPEIKVLFVVDTVTHAQIFLEAEPVQELSEGWNPFPGQEFPTQYDEYKSNLTLALKWVNNVRIHAKGFVPTRD